MEGWLKLFTDGTKEYGSDEAIAKHKASWTLGRLDRIKEVILSHNKKTCSLVVPNTSWYQFDRFSVLVSEGTPHSYRDYRVIQAEIQPHHLGQSIVCSKSGSSFTCTMVGDLIDSELPINKSHIGKWLTIIWPNKDYPRITFSTKGKINDH